MVGEISLMQRNVVNIKTASCSTACFGKKIEIFWKYQLESILQFAVVSG